MYRSLVLTGRTYSETELRNWIANTWRYVADVNKPEVTIAELAQIVAAGGWTILEKVA